MPFTSLGLADPILRALRDEGYDAPTPIQAQAIPHALDGRDLLGCAQTGTGKTAAFALPILHRLHAERPDKARRGPRLARALILSPTRELATQIEDSLATYGRHTGLSHTTIYGGVSQHRQVQALKRGVDIIVATPGRLIDLMDQGYVDLSGVGVLVLDEADRMLDMGFIRPIQRIAGQIPQGRQTLMFSATMPKEILRLAEALQRSPVKVSVTPVASAAPMIEQSVYMVPHAAKQSLLAALLDCPTVERAVVFTRTKHGADRVKRRLEADGVAAESIHGNKSQSQRNRALAGFRSGRSRVLVATDVAARGLDVDGVTHVFNYDLPNEPESYVHRIGRTGRAGAAGQAISFCDADERSYLKAIERLTAQRLRALPVPDHVAAQPGAEPDQRPHPRERRPEARHADERKPDARAPRPQGPGQPRRRRRPGASSAPAHAGASRRNAAGPRSRPR